MSVGGAWYEVIVFRRRRSPSEERLGRYHFLPDNRSNTLCQIADHRLSDEALANPRSDRCNICKRKFSAWYESQGGLKSQTPPRPTRNAGPQLTPKERAKRDFQAVDANVNTLKGTPKKLLDARPCRFKDCDNLTPGHPVKVFCESCYFRPDFSERYQALLDQVRHDQMDVARAVNHIQSHPHYQKPQRTKD